MLLIDSDVARRISVSALCSHGAPEAHASTQIELLVEAELMGYASHGLLRLPRILERIERGLVNPETAGSHFWRSPAFLEVDGQRGLGPVVVQEAMSRIVERASEVGIAVAAIRNNNHIGMLGWYTRKLAERGKVSIVLGTSEALVHPWGGRVAMIGTNPISIGIPCDPDPVVLDMATGVVSMGKIHDYAQRGEPIPDHWALDAQGNPTTDAEAAKQGAIAPFGGAKGYALGLAFEVLVAGLTQSALGADVKGTLDARHVCNKGDLLIVIDPPAHREMAAAVSTYLDAIRHCPPVDPRQPVMVPGDRALACRQRSIESGIRIEAEVWRRIQNAAEGETRA
ncbi:Ldh family oxidoreductase [Pseudochelatococcus sp. B33]